MELQFAFLANAAEVGLDGRFFVLGGGIDGIKLRTLPGHMPLIAIVASFHFTPEECGATYSLTVRLSRPDGSDSFVGTGMDLLPGVQSEAPEAGSNLKVAINIFGLQFSDEGCHYFNFFVDSREAGRLEFRVALDAATVPLGD